MEDLDYQEYPLELELLMEDLVLSLPRIPPPGFGTSHGEMVCADDRCIL